MNCLEEIYLELDSVNDDFVYFTDIFFKENDFVEEGDLIAVFESSKASIDIEANTSGYLKILFDIEAEQVKSGSKIFQIYDEELAGGEEINTKIEETILEDKLISKEVLSRNIDLKEFKDYDIITLSQLDKSIIDDKPIDNFLSNDQQVNKSLNIPKNINRINKTKFTENKLSPSKKTEGDFLIQSNFSPISQLTTLIQCSKPKNSPLKLIIYECSRLLSAFPSLNSCFINGKEIKYQQTNVGVAFDDGINGLKVAAIKNTNNLDINSIEDSLIDLSLKYSENKLNSEELSSSTFTVTDLYNSNTITFKPLLNVENSAILGISSYSQTLNGFNVELSFDHRLLSGLEISKFLSELKIRLENHLGSFEKDNQNSCMKCSRDLNENFDDSIYFLKTYFKGSNRLICSNCVNGW